MKTSVLLTFVFCGSDRREKTERMKNKVGNYYPLMNKRICSSCFILFMAPWLFGCGEAAKEETKTQTPVSTLSLHEGDEKYAVIDKTKSVVTWKGWNVFNSNSHNGYVYPSKGELLIENGQVISGVVEVDMNTIEDDKHGRKNNLVNHLKDTDFFDVKKFPVATIAITSVVPVDGVHKNVTGNLTIKGITHPVTFPANINVAHGVVKASGKLIIDRTNWNVRYKSGKFYDNLANETMSDSIEFHMMIVAGK